MRANGHFRYCAGHMEIYKELFEPWDVVGAAGYLAPLVLGLILLVKSSGRALALRELRNSYKTLLIPLLDRIPAWVSRSFRSTFTLVRDAWEQVLSHFFCLERVGWHRLG